MKSVYLPEADGLRALAIIFIVLSHIPNSFNSNGKFSYGTYFTTTTPFLEFSIQFQSNKLIYDKGYNK